MNEGVDFLVNSLQLTFSASFWPQMIRRDFQINVYFSAPYRVDYAVGFLIEKN